MTYYLIWTIIFDSKLETDGIIRHWMLVATFTVPTYAVLPVNIGPFKKNISECFISSTKVYFLHRLTYFCFRHSCIPPSCSLVMIKFPRDVEYFPKCDINFIIFAERYVVINNIVATPQSKDYLSHTSFVKLCWRWDAIYHIYAYHLHDVSIIHRDRSIHIVRKHAPVTCKRSNQISFY